MFINNEISIGTSPDFIFLYVYMAEWMFVELILLDLEKKIKWSVKSSVSELFYLFWQTEHIVV